MPKASVKRLIECKKEQLIDLVLDIEKYPQFVPFCLDSKVYERSKLVSGNYFQGPGLVVQMDCTVLVPPDWKAKVDGWHNLIIEQN